MSEINSSASLLPTPGTVFAGRTFDAVLFDMDGTLINSIPVTERCWEEWMTFYGFPTSTYHQFHGVPARALIAKLLPEEIREEAFQRILAMEMSDTKGIVVLPGAADVFRNIPAQARAVVTSATEDLAKKRLGVTGLETDYLVSADSVERGKPFPDPFLLGAQVLGVDPQRCLVFEDAPSGLQAGRAAGALTVAVPGTNKLEDLEADAYLESLDQIEFVWDAHSNTISVQDK